MEIYSSTYITVHDLSKLRELDKKIQILDVRENTEREHAHIKGTIHIKLTDIANRFEELDKKFWSKNNFKVGINNIKTNIKEISEMANIINSEFYIVIYPWPETLEYGEKYFNWQEFAIKVCKLSNCSKLINSFPHFQYLELGYLCFRAKKNFKLFLIIEKIFSILKMTKLPIPYNLGQTTFIFQKIDE